VSAEALTADRTEQALVPVLVSAPETVSTPPEAPAPVRSAWEAALDELDRSMDQAEALVAPGFLIDDSDVLPDLSWTPPAGLGPIPAGLADRAVTILDRQLELTQRLEEAASTARAHLRAVSSMRTNDTTTAVYLDAVG